MARKIGKSYSMGKSQGNGYGVSKFRGHQKKEGTHNACELMERNELGLFRAKASNTGLILIEAKEHQTLLRLYYAVYDDAKSPSADTEAAYLQALERCNTFYAGGTTWH